MPSSNFEIDPKFCHRGTAVIHSPFWWDGEPESDSDYLSWRQKQRADKDLLEEALAKARRYNDLGGRAKELFDAAEAFNGKLAKS